MLHQIVDNYQRKMWNSMISRKKLDINMWDLLIYAKESVFYKPYSSHQKFQINERFCRHCGKEFKIGFRKNDFIVKPCICVIDCTQKYQTQHKLESFFTSERASEVLHQLNEFKTRNFPNRIRYWIEKKGMTQEEAENKVKEIQVTRSKKSSSTTPGVKNCSVRCVDFWIEKKGMTQEEAENKVKEIQTTNGLEYYTKKYGIDGIEMFNTRIAKWNSQMAKLKKGVSMASVALFEQIDPSNKAKYGENETTVRAGKKVYRVDYYDKATKKIIEFDGDYWHANPLFYKEDDCIRNKTAKEIWDNDATKTKNLLDAGYLVLRITEHEYTTNPEHTVKKCIRFLND